MSGDVSFNSSSKIQPQSMEATNPEMSVSKNNPDVKMINGGIGKRIIDNYQSDQGNPMIYEKVKQLPLPPHPSQARANLEKLMEQKTIKVPFNKIRYAGKNQRDSISLEQDRNGMVSLPNKDLKFLASIKKNIDTYEKELKNEGTSTWASHVSSRIFAGFSLAKSITQEASDYYDFVKSSLTKAELKELEALEKQQ